MFSDVYEELSLATSIMNYLNSNENSVDVEVIKKMINDSPLDDEHKSLIVSFLKDYLFDHDFYNFVSNLESLCDMIIEKAD